MPARIDCWVSSPVALCLMSTDAMKCDRGAGLTGRATKKLLNQTLVTCYKGAHTEGSRQLDDVALAGDAIKLAARSNWRRASLLPPMASRTPGTRSIRRTNERGSAEAAKKVDLSSFRG